jgi:hypothetical protein
MVLPFAPAAPPYSNTSTLSGYIAQYTSERVAGTDKFDQSAEKPGARLRRIVKSQSAEDIGLVSGNIVLGETMMDRISERHEQDSMSRV